jgi:ATP-binding cassette, subfamily B, multidrug efflux pump
LTRLGKIYALTQWKWYLGGIFALILTNIIVLEIPQLAKKVINAVAIKEDLDPLTSLSLAIIGLGLAQILIRTTSRILIFWPGRTLEAAVKYDVFSNILKTSTAALANFSIGDLTSRLNNDVTQLRIFFAFGALQVLNVIFISIFTVSKMFSIDSVLTLLAISPMFLMLLITKAVMPKLHAAMRENTEALGRLTGKIAESFSQVHVIQSMNAVDIMLERSKPDNDTIFTSNIRTVKLRTTVWPVMIVLIGISQFATLAWGGKLVIAGTLTVGDIMAFNIYIGMLTFPFASLGIILNVYQRAKPAAERLETLTNLPAEGIIFNESASGHSITSDAGMASTKIVLDVSHISLRWPDGRVGLDDVSFTVAEGERVGIFGTIGSGKSTLFNILTRLHQQDNGQITLQGKNTLTMKPEMVRRIISYGLQQPLLFSESVRSNLSLGLDENEITQEDLDKAARRAHVYDDIMRLPHKWDTLIGENGIKLSGGQKQRLALARLLLRPSKIIILDDVLSAVDHETEHRLIKSLLETKTALVISSHRVSILEPCDKVLVLKNGRLVASGKYNDIKHLVEAADEDEPNQHKGETP